MTALLLVRHSLPELDRSRPAREWRLSEEGRRRCAALRAALARHEASYVYASTEPKALETAQLAAPPGVPVMRVDELREHDRRDVPWLDRDELERLIRETFERPDELVFGSETASAALGRFTHAVGEIERAHEGDVVAVVAHGTVISLFVAARTGIDGYELWRGLRLPALVVLEDGRARIEPLG